MQVVGMQKLKIAVITLNGTFPEVLDNKLTDESEEDVKTFDKKNYFVTFQTNLFDCLLKLPFEKLYFLAQTLYFVERELKLIFISDMASDNSKSQHKMK